MEFASSGQALSLRLSEQAHWQQALSVQDGRQPRVDPDNVHLESIGEELRMYRLQVVFGTMDAHPAWISQRIVKRLVGEWWETEILVDSYQRCLGPSTAL